MSCFLYGRSEREHKSHRQVPVPATFGPLLRLECVTHLFPAVPACVPALGGTDLGDAFRILLSGDTSSPPVSRGVELPGHRVRGLVLSGWKGQRAEGLSSSLTLRPYLQPPNGPSVLPPLGPSPSADGDVDGRGDSEQ